MKFLKKYPLFLLLLAVFFCLHGLVENYELIYIISLGATFFYTLLFIFAAYLSLNLFVKNKLYSAVVTFICCGYVLFFGAFLDFVKQFNYLNCLSKYSGFLSASILLLGILFFVLKRNMVLQQKIFYFLNLLFTLYILFDVVSLAFKINSNKNNKNETFLIDKKGIQGTPNVYLLLFDEYPGYESLSDSFNFKNDAFYNNMKSIGFAIQPTVSNYNMTFFSVSSMLNMKLVEHNYTANSLTAKDDINRFVEIKNNHVVNLFKKMGYQFNNYSIFDIGGTPKLYPNTYVKSNIDLITNKILPKRIFIDLGLNLFTKYPNNILANNYLNKNEESNKSLEYKIKTTGINKVASRNPTLTYAHFLMPHSPYYYDSTGKKYSNETIFNKINDNNKNYYLSYLKYVNKQIENMLHYLVAVDSGAIIIALSDHGFKSYLTTDNAESYFNNFCAVRMPNKSAINMKEHNSLVNLFPNIFNQYFGQSLPYQPDSTIFLKYR